MLKYKTLITQEMLKEGFLAATLVIVCTEHTVAVVDQYFDALDPVFPVLKNVSLDDQLITCWNGLYVMQGSID